MGRHSSDSLTVWLPIKASFEKHSLLSSMKMSSEASLVPDIPALPPIPANRDAKSLSSTAQIPPRWQSLSRACSISRRSRQARRGE